MIDQIYAKSGQKKETLIEHTENVLNVFTDLKKRVQGYSDEFWNACITMCLFHDSGKICENFQNALDGNYEEHIRHEMLSGVFLGTLSRSFLQEHSLFLMAIFSHHKKLNDLLFDDDKYKELNLPHKRVDDWFSYAIRQLKDLRVANYSMPGNKTLLRLSNSNSIDYQTVFFNFFNRVKLTQDTKSRINYITIKAILNICDWAGSGHFNLAPELEFDNIYLIERIRKKLIAEGKIKKEKEIVFREFQEKSKTNSNIIAIAPTGSGKTEAALIWASQKTGFDKIIYCLPTRVTSNAIHKRLTQYFGSIVGVENCAIIHSSALLYQKKINQDYDSRVYLRDRTFFRNISVCTIDQILTQGFNLGFWEVKTFHCRNAWIIIDEIHLYSPYTLALILNSIKYLKNNFNSRFFIMSATMPSKLLALLSNTLGSNYSIVRDQELLSSRRNIFEIREVTLQENLSEIIDSFKYYNKVLVVTNTVDQAIGLYKNLKNHAKDKMAICFHSRFIQKDRLNKENEILKAEEEGKPILLVATQVVEVSLDIDFDLMFTENAPIDSIIQRAGRVNRKRNSNKNSKIIVHQHSDVSLEFIYTEQDILNNTFSILKKHNSKKLTESELLQLVDEVYSDIDITQKLSYKDGERAYLEVQESHFYIGDVDKNDKIFTRELDSVSVIPLQYYEEVQLLTKKWEKAEYELSIRNWRYQHAKKPSDKDGFNYVDYVYDTDLGLLFTDERHSDANIIVSI